MKIKEIKSYTEKHIKAIKTLTIPSLMNLDMDIIHQWRIEMKKLKALMRMLDTTSSDFSFKKNYKKISPFYQLLGGIREIQLQLAQAKGQRKGFWKKYRLLLEKEMNEKQDRFLHKLDTPSVKYSII
jgi:CHAD domain-containing protein